jgi:hypothetical protein
MPTPLVPPSDDGGHPPDRQCGRCRRWFPGDPTLHSVALAEWWACPPCRRTLFGSRTPPVAAHVDVAHRTEPKGGST